MRSGMGHRIAGLVCLAVAGGFGWWGIWRPWQDALGHAPDVRFSPKIFVLVPAAAIFGLFFLIFGDSVPYRNAQKQNFTLAGWLLMLAVAAGSFATYWWFRGQFDALGYQP